MLSVKTWLRQQNTAERVRTGQRRAAYRRRFNKQIVSSLQRFVRVIKQKDASTQTVNAIEKQYMPSRQNTTSESSASDESDIDEEQFIKNYVENYNKAIQNGHTFDRYCPCRH